MKARAWRAALVIVALSLPASLSLRNTVASPLVGSPPDSAIAVRDSVAAPHRIQAFYFHTTQRCASCRKIEAYSREAIERAFTGEIKGGRLVFRLVNIDEKPNRHYIKDYKLYTKSLVLVEEKSGRTVRWKNLPKIWELLNDKEEFLGYVQAETKAYLADVP